MRKLSDIICGNHPPDWADNPKIPSAKESRRLNELTLKENARNGMKLSRREAQELHVIREHIRGRENTWQQTGIGKIIYYPNPKFPGETIKHNLTSGARESGQF